MENFFVIVSAFFYLSIMTASFIFLNRQDDQNSRRFRVVVLLYVFTILGIILDTLYRLDYGGLINLPSYAFAGVITATYVCLPVVWGLWYLYISHTLYLKEIPRAYNIVVAATLLLNLALSLISLIPGTNIYFTIVDGVYARGKLFFVQTIIFLLFLALTICFYTRFFKTFGKSERFTFLLIITTLILALVGHLLKNLIPFMVMNNVFNYMILAMNVQYIHASTDFLTGLANRRSLSNHLHSRMTGTGKTSSFSIIMFDLDNFKMINDTLGHDAGDDALRQFARFLRHHCDNVDFVARFGGDEFIIVLDSMSPAELKKRVAVIREQFSEYEGNKVGNFKLVFSAGYFIHNKDLKISTGELIRIIDERMFRDKRKRSNGKTN